MVAQDIAELATCRDAAESSEGLKNRKIGLSGPVVLDTLPPAYPCGAALDDVGHHGIDQSRLANARFAGNKSHPPCPMPRRVEPGLHGDQCAVAPHEHVR